MTKKTSNYIITKSKYLFVILIIFAVVIINNLITYNNIEKFKEITIKDPLFYSPNMNGKQLAFTVEKLKKIDDEILLENQKAPNYNNDINNIYPHGWRIWPDNFLKTLPEIDLTTKKFIKNPTYQNGEKLIALYAISVNEYKNAININIKSLKTVLDNNPKLTNKQIIFLGSATTPKIVLNDFLLIAKNADELEKEVKSRTYCLKFGKCDLKITYAKPLKKGVKVDYKPLPDEILGINRKTSKVYGPYFATTGCFGLSDGKPYSLPFYVVEKGESKDKLLVKPMLTNTKYYRDYKDISSRSPSNLITNSGITIRPHPETNDYMCTDFTYYPQLIMQYLKEKGQIKKDSSNNLEALPYIINNALNFNTYLVYNIKYSQKAYPPYFLLTVRSAYSIYFVTFSKAVWRLPQSPQFLIPQDFSEYMPESMYLTYEDLVKKGMSNEEIIKLNSTPRINDIFRDSLGKN